MSNFGGNAADDMNANPEIPRYNSSEYRQFKQECLTFLVSSHVVSVKNAHAHAVYTTETSYHPTCISESANGGTSDPNGNTTITSVPQNAASVFVT